MCKQNKRGSLRKAIKDLGEQAVIAAIADRHSVELSSPTRRREFDQQMKNPNAGPVVHLMACQGCANAIIGVARTTSSPAAFDTAFAAASATA
jgi:hypothetical protein